MLFVKYGDKREIAADLERIQKRATKPIKLHSGRNLTHAP